MTLTFHWFLPTTGDGRSIMGRGHSIPPSPAGWPEAPHIRGAAARERPPDIEYLAQVARSAEQLGFEAVLTPTGTWSEDAWLVTAALTAQDLEIYPNLWAGVGLVRGGAGTTLVGSHERVADLIEEYAALGISEFILSGYPHLEEAYWFGEGVLPEIRRREAAAGNSGRPHLRASA